MPTRSFYFPPDFEHVARILLDAHGPSVKGEVDRFNLLKLPPLIDERSLCFVLGISDRLIDVICANSHRHYRQFALRKSDGSKRTINAPRTYLKVIQWWINDNILSNVSIGPNIFGFVRGRSAVDNARFHKGAKHLLNVDIEHFFPSIRRESVYAIFVDIGYSPGVAAQLSNICTLDNALPQGAPTSPTIANLIFRDVDKKIGDLADENELLYSRYADDLTFSSLEYIDGSFIKKLSEILYSARFRLKQTKTRFSSHGSRMEITGLTVNDYVHPSREWRRKARAMLHKYANSPQLSDLEVDRINGIKGIANMVDNSPSMLSIKRQLERLSELRFKNPNR